jgi:hypothetical protein
VPEILPAGGVGDLLRQRPVTRQRPREPSPA